MGQVVLGLMYGVRAAEVVADIDDFCQDFHYESPRWCDGAEVLGYSVVADLEDKGVDLPIDINAFDRVECARIAKQAWTAFDAYAGLKGVTLAAAGFYLVRTEIG